MKRYVLFLLLAGCCSVGYAQEVIRGIVADSASFRSLPYVNVLVKNKNKGTSTDLQGAFSLMATTGDTLVFSLIGYKPIELPLQGWEPSLILLAENVTLLDAVTIKDSAIENPYEGMFDEQNQRQSELNAKIPFYYARARKDKIKAERFKNENMRIQTYVDVMINTPEVKENLIKKYTLTDDQYYDLLAQFNEKNYLVMYYLTAGELVTLVNNFYARHAKE